MREEISMSPTAWLSKAPIPIPSPASVLSAFKPGTAKVVRFTGLHKFYRAAGWDATRGGLASAYGSWWVDEMVLIQISHKIDLFENWFPKSFLKRALPSQYRGATALCEDWNDMRDMFKLVLPHQNEITGIAGLAAPQPQKSHFKPVGPKTSILKGGAEQIYFKKTRTLNSINPLWVYKERLW